MTTKAERRKVRTVIRDSRIWSRDDLLEAILEEEARVDAIRWLRGMARTVAWRLEVLERSERNAKAYQRAGTIWVDCQRCGDMFQANSRARYCSSVCRQQAYRERLRAAHRKKSPGDAL